MEKEFIKFSKDFMYVIDDNGDRVERYHLWLLKHLIGTDMLWKLMSYRCNV
ncbi:hypothetical protein [Clostridium collagenovorans]|uniref:hypothetical protein n=1 Tax=Clostridium collagenovorans TaxID=29357 RepID=UPI0015BB369E|nr:hypothetical protein [Clostridium collagenovorans]